MVALPDRRGKSSLLANLLSKVTSRSQEIRNRNTSTCFRFYTRSSVFVARSNSYLQLHWIRFIDFDWCEG